MNDFLMYQMNLMKFFQGSRYIKKYFLLCGPIWMKKRFIGFIEGRFGLYLTNIYQLINKYRRFECIKCIWMNLRVYLGEKSSPGSFAFAMDEPSMNGNLHPYTFGSLRR